MTIGAMPGVLKGNVPDIRADLEIPEVAPVLVLVGALLVQGHW